MQNKKLEKVAEEIGQEIMAGEEEISLDQPFPEELDTGNKKSTSETKPKDSAADNKPEDEEPGNKKEEIEKKKAKRFRKKVNRIVLLFVGVGIVISILGLILMIAAGFLAGLIALAIGVVIILYGVLAPPGY
jgi:uncharacterized membrane protein